MAKNTLIESTKWEVLQKEDFQKAHSPLRNAICEGGEKGYDFHSFTQDLFGSLYQIAPEVSDEVSPGQQWQKRALEAMNGLREYKDLRNAGTVMNGFHAGLGATTLANHFSEALPKMETQNPDAVNGMIKAYTDFLENYEGHPEFDKVAGERKKLQDTLPASEKEWSDKAPDGQDLRMMLRAGMKKAQEACEDAEEAALPFGFGTEPGTDGYSDAQTKLELAKRVQSAPKLREIAELAGRFRREARKAQASKKQPGPDEVTEIEMGANLNRVLLTELVRLRHPLMKKDFARKMLSKRLLQYRMEEVEKKDRGPIVVCLDSSGSMSGKKEIWSKAVALAMCQIAMDQNRTFEVLHFDVDLRRKDVFPAGKSDPMKLVESMTYFASGGGTKFAPILAHAFKDIADAAEKDLSDADVVFITDGQSELSTEAQADIEFAKKATGASIYTICLGGHAPALEPVSDEILDLRDLTTPEDIDEAKQIIFSV